MLRKYTTSLEWVSGCDEVGRGCLAGPVVAAAVILPDTFENQHIADSKKLSRQTREMLDVTIKKNAISWAIGLASVGEIDEMNILNASFLAMHRAIAKLTVQPHLLLIDGPRFTVYKKIPHICIKKGDGKYREIAAASILAKNYRDALMRQLAKKYEGYHWHTNVGYPTKAHRKAIEKWGITKHHRKTFALCTNQNKKSII